MDAAELRRGMGYVIQHVGLFPHRTIARERRHRAAPARLGPGRRPRTRVDELLELVGLAPRARRALPAPALRRAAATGRGGPRVGRGSAGDAHGRAVLRRRPGRARPAAGRVPAPAGASWARRSSSSPTTSTRPSSSATRSRCCGSAGGSPRWPSRPTCSPTRPTTSSPTSSDATAATAPSVSRRPPRLTLHSSPPW